MSDGELAASVQGQENQNQVRVDSEFLILAGPEINEPIARYGPFVMNTREEINQAITGLPKWKLQIESLRPNTNHLGLSGKEIIRSEESFLEE